MMSVEEVLHSFTACFRDNTRFACTSTITCVTDSDDVTKGVYDIVARRAVPFIE